MVDAEHEIQVMIDRETQAWDAQDVELLLSVFHPDMVWPWPPTNQDHDPMTWDMVLGRYDHDRWKRFYEQYFHEHRLIHNHRRTQRIVVSKQGDGALAVVDIDTLWEDRSGKSSHWHGRVCKVYTKAQGKWLITMHTGVLSYDPGESAT